MPCPHEWPTSDDSLFSTKMYEFFALLFAALYVLTNEGQTSLDGETHGSEEQSLLSIGLRSCRTALAACHFQLVNKDIDLSLILCRAETVFINTLHRNDIPVTNAFRKATILEVACRLIEHIEK